MTPDGGAAKADVLAFITGGYTISAQHLIRGPKAQIKLLPEAATQTTIKPRLSILHSNAGGSGGAKWWQLWTWLSNSSVTGEPHLDVGLDGTLAQFMPFNIRADCNYKANSFAWDGQAQGAISFETEDYGAATVNTTPWTLDQTLSIIRMLTCLCVVYRIRCTPTAHAFDSGIGYHSQFAVWSNAVGKTCPGYARIRQMPYILGEVQKCVAAYCENTGTQCP